MTNSNASVNSNGDFVAYPHLIYRLDFLETAIFKKDVWQANTKDGILESIVDEARNVDNVGKPLKDSKIVVAIELPIGGEVSKYSIGETDDTLKVTIVRHELMLNPKALLFVAIKSGHLSDATDGPYTARGEI